ncbi:MULTISPECIES: UvrD-helicase domain-containing protein [unclassified Streptomyces]|uniref:UvrD-helicase domain-containing protein n=1 Tax=unclassified Streptomyces TaxID=2593676 RepID=UPI000CD5AAF1|nr:MULTISPECIES: UvrD-helicase domain-containing protein [unclassified Streptomyces]
MAGAGDNQRRVTLRLLAKADKQIVKLDSATLAQVYTFQHEFRKNPEAAPFRLKQLSGDGRLWSARLARGDYRALLLRLGPRDWLLVAVKHRREVYDNLDRLRYGINRVTGAIDYVDLVATEDEVASRSGKGNVIAAPTSAAEGSAQPSAGPRPTFADHSDEVLLDLGVAEPLLPIIRKLTTDEELLGLLVYAPRHTGEVLMRLADGASVDQVRRDVTEPVTPEPAPAADADDVVERSAAPADDWQAAVARSEAVVITDDTTLESIIEEGDFGRWKNFLHPTQERLVSRAYSGPARVGGGPGTGKTIVALHRVKHLVDSLAPGNTKPVLLTTFNRNLAADLRARLLSLGGAQLVARVDIVHVDQLANRVVSEAEPGNSRRRIDDATALREWRDLLTETGETRWPAEFLADEWNQVILGQAVTSRSEYFKARRAGRGRSVSRPERAGIWQLAERFAQRLETRNLETYRQVAERAARLEITRAAKIEARAREAADRAAPGNIHVESGTGSWQRHRYRHIVVDEAQDLSPAHWKMLRAMAPRTADDLFLVGDTHQRIYDNQVTLGSLGINIRGRSARLTLSYRTTREILHASLALLEGINYDDLDGDTDDLSGYRSVLHGDPPELKGAPSWDDELGVIVQQLLHWSDAARESMAICVPTNEMANEVMSRLARRGIVAARIEADGTAAVEGVHIGTMYRFKGLEYRRMIIAGVSEGRVPRASVDRWEHTDPTRHQRELQRARSLLFVAATRARDALTITWHGEPSRFLKPLLPT